MSTMTTDTTKNFSDLEFYRGLHFWPRAKCFFNNGYGVNVIGTVIENEYRLEALIGRVGAYKGLKGKLIPLN